MMERDLDVPHKETSYQLQFNETIVNLKLGTYINIFLTQNKYKNEPYLQINYLSKFGLVSLHPYYINL